MTQFLNSASNLNGISNRCLQLKNLLLQSISRNADPRIIVFVRARKTCRILCKLLNDDKEIKKYWHPHEFVGHAEMAWIDDQEPRLNKFVDGFCRLLVATNVLQEGLDVPICDKVVLFDPLLSLTELIQSRGRARHQTSEVNIYLY